MVKLQSMVNGETLRGMGQGPRAGELLWLKDCLSTGILESVVLIGKLFGRSKSEPVEIKVTASFASDKLFRRATKRIFAKYKETIRKLGP